MRAEAPIRPHVARTAALLAIFAACMFACSAQAQEAPAGSARSIDLGTRGGPAGAGSATFDERAAGAFGFSMRAGAATDYIYRGTTLSNRRPAVGAAFETVLDKLYAGATVTSVSLPSQPAVELTMGGGVRPKFGPVEFDVGWTYFAYPGELPGNDTEYWEALGRASTQISEQVRIGGGFGYSPNVSNTGAWSKYAAAGFAIEAPRSMLPQNVTAALSGGAGYFWFGNQKAEFGGFPLPSYANWNVGVAFSHRSLNLDLRYYDTNLSRENCFVYTGDPGATPGGRIDPVTNPEGLISRWCGASFVAKFWFALN